MGIFLSQALHLLTELHRPADDVILAATQALYEIIQAQEARLKDLEAHLAELQRLEPAAR